ncbi:MAG: hypothetical protein KGJ86_03985 [Chloroflexota bacterium]|nr:hypothetical protein [Chloroflexota bacterium]
MSDNEGVVQFRVRFPGGTVATPRLHREVATALLESALPHGTKKLLAADSGITPEYVSKLLHSPATHPSEFVIQAIVSAIPLDPERKQFLYEQMIGSRGRDWLRVVDGATSLSAEHWIDALTEAHQRAIFAEDAQGRRVGYATLSRTAREAVKHVDGGRHPWEFAKACLFVHDAECVLNRPDRALLYAGMALDALEEAQAYERSERLHELSVNSVVAKGVAYRNLHLEQRALDAYEEANDLMARAGAPGDWHAFTARNEMNALSRTARFGIKRVEELADYCKRTGADMPAGRDRDLWLAMVDESLARGYVNHGSNRNLREAEDVLESLERRDLSFLGPLHRAMLFRTTAALSYAQRDERQWIASVSSAVVVCLEADLKHQLAEIEQQFGESSRTLMHDLRQASAAVHQPA